MHRTCPLLGVLGRRRVRGGPPQGCTALARFLAFLAAGEYGARRRKNGALSAPPPQGFTALARFLAFLAAGEYGARRRKNGALSAPPLPRGAPPLPASWPSTSVLDLVTDVPVLVTDCRNGCLDVSIGRCESA